MGARGEDIRVIRLRGVKRTEGAPPSGWEGGCWGARVPRGLKRYYGRGHLHFVTFSCYRRLPLLGSRHARDAFVTELGRVRGKFGFLLLGYVVMPEHVHVLMSEPRHGTPSTLLQMLKQRVARRLRRRKKRSRAGQMAFAFAKGEAGGPALSSQTRSWVAYPLRFRQRVGPSALRFIVAAHPATALTERFLLR
jgi:REP element-mobilizing transposase RayT